MVVSTLRYPELGADGVETDTVPVSVGVVNAVFVAISDSVPVVPAAPDLYVTTMLADAPWLMTP
jgi:hypothetical protein